MFQDANESSLLRQVERRRIYDYLRERPGIHLRKMQRELGMALGTLEYHLYRLERAGMVAVRRLGRFKAYYPEGMVDLRDKDLLYFLRQEMPRRIAMASVERPGVTFQELAAWVPISPSTLSFHLQKLTKAGILVSDKLGREKTYRCPDADRVRRLIVDFRATFVDDLVDRFADAWASVDPTVAKEAAATAVLPGSLPVPSPAP